MEMLADFIERNKASVPDEAIEKIIWADNPGGVTFQITWSKMRELISNKQYHALRKDNNLQLSPAGPSAPGMSRSSRSWASN